MKMICQLEDTCIGVRRAGPEEQQILLQVTSQGRRLAQFLAGEEGPYRQDGFFVVDHTPEVDARLYTLVDVDRVFVGWFACFSLSLAHTYAWAYRYAWPDEDAQADEYGDTDAYVDAYAHPHPHAYAVEHPRRGGWQRGLRYLGGGGGEGTRSAYCFENGSGLCARRVGSGKSSCGFALER